MLYSDYLTKSVTDLATLTGEGRFHGKVVLKYSISYPNIRLNRRMLPGNHINSSYIRFAQNARRHIINNYYGRAARLYASMGDEFSPLEIMCEMSVMYENRGFLSVFFDTYEKIGDIILCTRRHSDTWNLSIGKVMPLGSFFHMGAPFRSIFLREISDQVKNGLETEPDRYFADWQDILPAELDLRNFYLADDGFVIFFPEYSIAPKRSGLPSFLVPYKMFGSALKYDL